MSIIKSLLFGVIFMWICLGSTTLAAQDKTAAGLYNDGLALLKEKDYAGGLALLEEALSIAGPEDDKVIELAKKNGSIAAFNLANDSRKSKDYDGAITLFEKGIELNPTNSSLYEGIARCQESKGNNVAAVKAYLTAAVVGMEEGKDDRAEQRQNKAETMVGKLFVDEQYDEAIACGEAFLGIKDDVAEVHYYVARSYGEKGDAEKSLHHATRAIELSGDLAEDKYYYAQGTQYEALGKNAEAIEAYKKISSDQYKQQAEYKISSLGG